jgi:ribose/xylose/arabinose/galactoside ABC-type transport system permease subunit
MAELTFYKIAKKNKGLYVALAGLLVAAVVINFATGVNFFKLSNLLNVTRSFCILGIASIGQAIVIISGSGGWISRSATSFQRPMLSQPL